MLQIQVRQAIALKFRSEDFKDTVFLLVLMRSEVLFFKNVTENMGQQARDKDVDKIKTRSGVIQQRCLIGVKPVHSVKIHPEIKYYYN